MASDDDDFVDSEPMPDIFDPEVLAQIEERSGVRRSAMTAQAEAHLRRMKSAYTAVFVTGTPTSSDIEFVMQDLFWFCRGNEHYFPDARLQDVMAGRKQMLQRVVEYTRFDFNTLQKMYIEAQK